MAAPETKVEGREVPVPPLDEVFDQIMSTFEPGGKNNMNQVLEDIDAHIGANLRLLEGQSLIKARSVLFRDGRKYDRCEVEFNFGRSRVTWLFEPDLSFEPRELANACRRMFRLIKGQSAQMSFVSDNEWWESFHVEITDDGAYVFKGGRKNSTEIRFEEPTRSVVVLMRFVCFMALFRAISALHE